MDSMMRDLFGGDDDDRRRQVRDYVSRYEQGPIDQGYSDAEAYENFQRVSQRVDPDTMQRAAEQTFARMDPGQRAQIAQLLQQRSGQQLSAGAQDDPRQLAGMVSRIQQENPGGLASLFGGGGGGGIGEAIGNLFGGGDDTTTRRGEQGDGFPGGTLGKVALGGIAAFALKELLSGGDDDRQRRRSV